MMLMTPGTAEGPLMEVLSPEDGGWVTDPDLQVIGNATPPTIVQVLGEDFFSNGTGFGFSMDGRNLTLRPRELFSDEFSGATLDTTKWDVLRYEAGISLVNDHLKMVNGGRNYPLVSSRGAMFPSDADWMARFQMQMVTNGYSGSGGGVSDSSTVAESSHLAAYNLWAGWGQDSYKVYSNGAEVLSYASDRTDHLYVLTYDADGNRFTCYIDGDELDSFSTTTMPDMFWFGSSSTGLWQLYSSLEIDYVDVWAFNGIRTFEPIEYPFITQIDRIDANLTTNSPNGADLDVEARMSLDNQTWSSWVPMIDGVPPEDVEGKYLQIRLTASFKGLRDTSAMMRLSDLTVSRHHPVTSLEVRNVDTDGLWSNATGLESWKASVPLVEGMNTIQVRATDTTGAVNVTSFEQLLDTVPPTGTMHILKDRPFTNSLNVTLHLNATDLYGIQYVDVSNADNMRDAIRYPYKETIDWRMAGTDGEVTCYVRFIDPHGLESPIIADSIMYDSIPPSGELVIHEGKEYTPSLTVDLDVSYSDTRGIQRLEVSNQANFTDVGLLEVGETRYANWTLAEGGDGPRTVHLKLTDLAGNVRVVNSTIEYYAPKSIGAMVIDGGANITKNPTVLIEVDVSLKLGPRMMQLSNDAAFIDAVWEPLADEVIWILSPDDGHKVIYLRFIDFREIVSIPINATITLDSTAPKIDIMINGGSQYTTQELVEVRVDYRDASPAASMWIARIDRFNEADEVPFSSVFPWTVPPREGAHDLYIRVRDMAGNEVVAHGSIFYAGILPKVRVTLPDGDVTGSRHEVSVNAEATDQYGAVEFAFAMDGDPLDDPTWRPDEGPFQVDIPDTATEGVHQVMVRARNAPGLISELAVINVTLDWTGPVITLESPDEGSVLPQVGLDVLLQLTAHDPSGIASARFRVDGGQWTGLEKDDLSAVMTMDDFGEHTVAVEVTDGVGNTADARSTFTVENSETQVASGNSWVFLVLIVIVVALAGIGYTVLKHRQRSSGEEHGKSIEAGNDKLPVEGQGEAPLDSPGTPAEEPVSIKEPSGPTDVPEADDQVVHTDDDGTEWEMV
jgi:hypothetical protein